MSQLLSLSFFSSFFLPSVVTVNNITRWERLPVYASPCKLPWKACWHCPSQLITAAIKALSQQLKWRRHSGVTCIFFFFFWCFFFFVCVFMSVIQRCRGSVAFENLSSSWQLIIIYISPPIIRGKEPINDPHLSLWSSLHHSRGNWINISHICDPAALPAPR